MIRISMFYFSYYIDLILIVSFIQELMLMSWWTKISLRKNKEIQILYRSSGFIEVAPTNTASLTSTTSSRSAHNACSFIPFAPSPWTPTPRACSFLVFDLSSVTIHFFRDAFMTSDLIFFLRLWWLIWLSISIKMDINFNNLRISRLCSEEP